jgi:signal transduction histidine kinase
VKSVLPLKVVLPLALGIIASLAIAVYAELGYRRLESANRQMAVALEMQSTLNEALALIVDAETGQRGYLLSGKEEYLAPYNSAVPKLEGVLNRLREALIANGTPAQRDALGHLSGLVGKKLAELEAAIALHKKGRHAGAQGVARNRYRQADDGRNPRRGGEDDRRVIAASSTRRPPVGLGRAFARLGMQLMTAFLRGAAAGRVAARTPRRPRATSRRRSMAGRQAASEPSWEERTAACRSSPITCRRCARTKIKLARDIHDELGGILVSAKMDVAWVEAAEETRPGIGGQAGARAQTLDDGVQIKRRIIEELRPTLLDNLGLSAAIDWQVHEICDRAGLDCAIATPQDDSTIAPEVSIVLYRILQEALTNIVKYAHAKNVSVDLGLTGETITLLIEDDGVGIPEDAQNNLLSHGIVGMRQRVRALHGEFGIARRPEGGTVIEVNIPRGPQPEVVQEPAPADA